MKLNQLPILFEQFPITEQYHQKYLEYFNTPSSQKKGHDFSYLYGKLMKNALEDENSNALKNFTDKVKETDEKQAKIVNWDG